jgi:hypothetical protein
MYSHSVQCCSALPRPQQWAVGLSVARKFGIFVLISLCQACSASHLEKFIDKSEEEISKLIANPILTNN